jgi:putative Holliday junction resolvase
VTFAAIGDTGITMTLVTIDRVAFRQALPHGGRLIGMDVGTKTIGLALCDAAWTIASPAYTVTRGKFGKDKIGLAAFIDQQQVKGVVIGLPLNLDGSFSPRAQASRAFAHNIADLGLPILLWVERWSTQAVTRTLLEADASRARRDELVDKLAASYILQGAIDGLVAGLE